MSQQQPTPDDAGGPRSEAGVLSLVVNGEPVEVPDAGETLLAVLRERLGLTAAKDGCSPQGQCGCCTVLVDGKPRVACVTPARRVRGRAVTTLEGLDEQRRQRWGDAFCAVGGSQCGFCTPGIIMRLDALADTDAAGNEAAVDEAAVDQALLAHLCRCTGWQTIHEAWRYFHTDTDSDTDTDTGSGSGSDSGSDSDTDTDTDSDTGTRSGSATDTDSDTATGSERSPGRAPAGRDRAGAARRAELEGGAAQLVSPEVALGLGGFAADTAPDDALIAVTDGAGGWVLGETLTEARSAAGKVQGRRTTAAHRWPLEVPPGDWQATLRTTWVDPAYLETDASWCEPGGEPASIVANGGAFGGKAIVGTGPATVPGNAAGGPAVDAPLLDVRTAARELADRHQRAVLVLASREDVAARSPKRPPVAGGMNADCSGLLRVVATPGISEAIAAAAPGLVVDQVPVPGPPTSAGLRAAGWAEAVVLTAGATGEAAMVRSPQGATAEADIEGGVIKVAVGCGRVLDHIVLRSYCIGAAHMAWSWLTSEAMSVDEAGTVHDLTVRSFGVLRAVDTPPIEIEIIPGDREPVNGSDAVFAAVAAAGWLANDCAQDWPIG